MDEYKIITIGSPIEVNQLNELGQEGWILVSVITSDYWDAGAFIYYFSRNTEKDARIVELEGHNYALNLYIEETEKDSEKSLVKGRGRRD